MAKCSRCGVVETVLHINGVPVCLDCDKKNPQPPDSAWVTRSGPPKKVQNIEDLRATKSPIPIEGSKHR